MILKTKKKIHGFTLIELLIVIAIIGILAAVLIPNLLSARGKAVDASIKAELRGVMTQAQVYYQSCNTYGTCGTAADVCNDTSVNQMFGHATNISGTNAGQLLIDLNTPSSWTNFTQPTAACIHDNDHYAILVPLKTNNTKAFCVDSNGYAGEVNFDAVNSTTNHLSCN